MVSWIRETGSCLLLADLVRIPWRTSPWRDIDRQEINMSSDKKEIDDVLEVRNTFRSIKITDLDNNLSKTVSDPLKFKDNTSDLNVEQLVSLSVAMFKQSKVFATFKMCDKKLYALIKSVYLHHRDNAYHNCHHACHVLLNTYRFLSPMFACIPQIDVLIVLLSALCHDLDHAGVTNAVLINKKNDLASKYSFSQLENHSIDEAFLLFANPETNILENLSDQDKGLLITSFKDLILSTDIGNQDRGAFIRKEWENYFAKNIDEKEETKKGETKEENQENLNKIFVDNFQCRLALYRVLLMIADIGIVCELKSVYAHWVVNLFKESSTFDTLVPINYYQGQEKFLKFYAAPMIEKLKAFKYLNFGAQYLEQFSANREMMSAHVRALENNTSNSEHIQAV